MPRFPKPWYRKNRRRWFVQIDGKQVNLGPDREKWAAGVVLSWPFLDGGRTRGKESRLCRLPSASPGLRGAAKIAEWVAIRR